MKFATTSIYSLIASLTVANTAAFVPVSTSPSSTTKTTVSSRIDNTVLYASNIDRRTLLASSIATASAGLWLPIPAANAEVFFDPAQYGDQELRVSAVDSLKESVRRAILKDPALAPSFYQLALLDGLSYNAKTKKYGPDGSILKVVLSSKNKNEYTRNLQTAALAIADAEKALRKKTAIGIADAIAIGGAEAVETIGGPYLVVQLGRADAPLKAAYNENLSIDILSGERPFSEVQQAFQDAGLTDREMTALLGALLTLEYVEKTRSVEDWRQSVKPKFREPGKLGRMSDFKALTEEDIAQAALDAELEDPDDGWYIADSFGTRSERFGDRLAKDDIDEKSFNKYIKAIADYGKKKDSDSDDIVKYGWIAEFLLDPNIPTAQTWLNKYSGSNLSYLKDLNIAYNAMTQLGAVYTGGKYENLLKNRPRKSLNDDDLKLF